MNFLDRVKAAPFERFDRPEPELRNPPSFWESSGLRNFASRALNELTPYGAGRDLALGIKNANPFQAALGLAGSVPGLPMPRAYNRIPGTPATFKLPGGEVMPSKPIPGIVDAAHDYAKATGLRMEMPRAFPKQDPGRARDIAAAFDKGIHNPSDPAVQRSAEALKAETVAQLKALNDRGYEFRFMTQRPDGEVIDPYAASPAMGYKDLAENKRLEIFPTETGGFGSSSLDVSDNPLLERIPGVTWGEAPVTYNDAFRAVHDTYGHFGHGNPFFRAPGEERAWQLHAGMFSPEARKLMTTETRGQNSWVNYGPHGDHNRTASGADTVFADQKTMLMPDWVQSQGRAAPIFPVAPFLPTGGNADE